MSFELVAVGTSSGGLEAIEVLIKDLPPHFPLAVVVVTHRVITSSNQLSQALQAYSRLPIIEPEDRELILPGRIYLAPADYHLLIEAGEEANYFTFSTEAPVSYARPSIDVLFESAADVYGQNLIGIILTGANFDGAEGLAKIIALREHVRTVFKGGIYTIMKVVKFVPPLPHPVLEYKPPMFDLVQVWRIGGKIP